jgi:hypothetical protein
VNRPLTVTILAWIYIAVGVAGFISGLQVGSAFQLDDIFVEFVRLLAVVAGVFMLRGLDWARWLSLAWMGFHVILRQCAIFALRVTGEHAARNGRT